MTLYISGLLLEYQRLAFILVILVMLGVCASSRVQAALMSQWIRLGWPLDSPLLQLFSTQGQQELLRTTGLLVQQFLSANRKC